MQVATLERINRGTQIEGKDRDNLRDADMRLRRKLYVPNQTVNYTQ